MAASQSEQAPNGVSAREGCVIRSKAVKALASGFVEEQEMRRAEGVLGNLALTQSSMALVVGEAPHMAPSIRLHDLLPPILIPAIEGFAWRIECHQGHSCCCYGRALDDVPMGLVPF